MNAAGNAIAFDNVSRFYGEVLGINRVNLSIPPGVTSLVGPNGSGKTTLMNIMCGLLRPTQGSIHVFGIPPGHPERLCRLVGYCAQFDAFPKGLTGYQFIYSYLRVHGMTHAECDRRTWQALERVNMRDAAARSVVLNTTCAMRMGFARSVGNAAGAGSFSTTKR